MMGTEPSTSTAGISAIHAIRREIFTDAAVSASAREEMSAEESELLGLIRERLESSVYVAIRGIKVTLHEGKLYFFGTVPTFYTKQVLLSLAEDLGGAGVVQIVDKTIVLKH